MLVIDQRNYDHDGGDEVFKVNDFHNGDGCGDGLDGEPNGDGRGDIQRTLFRSQPPAEVQL